MKKLKRLCLCAAAGIFLLSGCAKKKAEEPTTASTTAEETTTAAQAAAARVTLGSYKGIEIKEYLAEVTDEDVEAQIQVNVSRYAEKKEVTDRPAQIGDTVNIDYVGMKDGVPFAGGTADGYDLTLGTHTFIDGFEEGIVGANVGDELSLNLTFPEAYGNADLAGAAVVFDVTVNKISAAGELNDEFVQQVSKTSKTVEEYREEVRRELEESAKEDSLYHKQDEAMDQVIAAASFEGLEEQVAAEIALQMEEITGLMTQQGTTLEEYVKMNRMTMEQFNESMKTEVENSMKMKLVTDEIAKRENLKASDSDRMTIARWYGLESPDELVSAYGEEAVDEVALRICVMNFLVDNAKIITEE